MPKDDPVENGNPLWFNVETHDESGNITANPKQMVHCQVGFTDPDLCEAALHSLQIPINVKPVRDILC